MSQSSLPPPCSTERLGRLSKGGRAGGPPSRRQSCPCAGRGAPTQSVRRRPAHGSDSTGGRGRARFPQSPASDSTSNVLPHSVLRMAFYQTGRWGKDVPGFRHARLVAPLNGGLQARATEPSNSSAHPLASEGSDAPVTPLPTHVCTAPRARRGGSRCGCRRRRCGEVLRSCLLVPLLLCARVNCHNKNTERGGRVNAGLPRHQTRRSRPPAA